MGFFSLWWRWALSVCVVSCGTKTNPEELLLIGGREVSNLQSSIQCQELENSTNSVALTCKLVHTSLTCVKGESGGRTGSPRVPCRLVSSLLTCRLCSSIIQETSVVRWGALLSLKRSGRFLRGSRKQCSLFFSLLFFLTYTCVRLYSLILLYPFCEVMCLVSAKWCTFYSVLKSWCSEPLDFSKWSLLSIIVFQSFRACIDIGRMCSPLPLSSPVCVNGA